MTTTRNDPPELMTLDEVAALFRVSTATVRRWLVEGLPYMKVRRTLRFQRGAVMEWAETFNEAA